MSKIKKLDTEKILNLGNNIKNFEKKLIKFLTKVEKYKLKNNL